MIVIVEGIDRVGKTTLCKKIQDKIGLAKFERTDFMKLREFDNKNETDKMMQLVNVVDTTNSDVIFDRLHLSDYVYGNIERGYKVEESNKYFDELDSYISKKEDVFLILVLSTDIKKSSLEHGKDLLKYEDSFKVLYKKSKIKNKFQCTYNTLDEVSLFIESLRSK